MGPLSPVMMMASNGLLQNQGLKVNGNLTLVINSYLAANAVSSFQSVFSNALAGVSGNLIDQSTLTDLASIGANNFPALTNSIPANVVAGIQATYGNSIANVYGNTVYTFTDIVLAQANRLIGNVGNGADLSILAQVYNSSEGYRAVTNQFINSVNAAGPTDATFTNMNALTTGGVTQITTDVTRFGSDIDKLGFAIGLSRLDYLGNPWALLLQMIEIGGLLPSLETALTTSGVTSDDIAQVRSATVGVSAALNKKIYKALTLVKGNDLVEVKNLLSVTTPNLTTAADLLNPVKMLPNTYQTLITQLPSGTSSASIDQTIYDEWSQYSVNWSKGQLVTSLDRNWGLYRSWYGSNPSPVWGSNGTVTDIPGTVSVAASGTNVDVVIVDAVIDPNHPEFAVRRDGTGGSRVKYFNWYSLNIPGDPMASSIYNPPINTAGVSSDNSNHACHVAGTAAGNTQGWAPNANIYNISPQYVTGGVSYLFLYKYILAWHQQKRANGDMTPTIVNNSWYSRYTIPYASITAVNYRGVNYAGPFTIGQLQTYGINVNSSNNAIIALKNAIMDADIQACINAGIIMVACAGNDDTKITTDPSDVDYNNTVTAPGYNTGNPIYYSQGSSPGATSNVLCIGAIRAGVTSPGGPDAKANFSNCGPRVDLFAPGAYITSAWLSSTPPSGTGYSNPVPDPRNSAYYIAKDSGTSMSSPQVCGILACALEVNPNLNQTSARTLIIQAANIGQIPDSLGGPTDVFSLQGAPNRYLTLPQSLYLSTTPSTIITVNIYTQANTVNDKIYNFYKINPAYLELSLVIPPDQAAANLAWARSLSQVKNIKNITLPAFSGAVVLIEPNTGLTKINELTTALPAVVSQSVVSTLGTGSGTNGKLTIYDFMGTLAGYPYVNQFPLVTANISSVSSTSLIPLINPTTGIYGYMNNTLAGDYDDPLNPGQIIIPSGPAAGTYGNMNIAFTTGLIPAAVTIVGNVAIANPNQAANANVSMSSMANQINLEDTNLKLAQVDFANLQPNSRSSIQSISTGLHDIGQDVSINGSSQFFNAIADTASLAGQAVIASMREGRNIAVLGDIGIQTDTQLPIYQSNVINVVR